MPRALNQRATSSLFAARDIAAAPVSAAVPRAPCNVLRVGAWGKEDAPKGGNCLSWSLLRSPPWGVYISFVY